MEDGSSSRCNHTQHQATFRCHISETPYIHDAAPKHQRVISVGYLVRSEWYSQPSVTTPLCVSGTSKREAIRTCFWNSALISPLSLRSPDVSSSRRLKLQCFFMWVFCYPFVWHLLSILTSMCLELPLFW
jgi:hypothetical protein